MATKNITSFSFSNPSAIGVISGTSIRVTVPAVTDVTALVANFMHTGASIAIGNTAQVSGITSNDFSSVVTYTVTASDATTKDYAVTVAISQVTVSQIAQLRRLVGDTTLTYTDVLLTAYIEKYPHLDEQGEEPYELSGSLPPAHIVNEEWIPTYDLHAAAADVWEEKATAFVGQYDFSADGGNYSRSQAYEQCMARVRYHRARRMPMTARMIKSPDEYTGKDTVWIGNLPEPRDS